MAKPRTQESTNVDQGETRTIERQGQENTAKDNQGQGRKREGHEEGMTRFQNKRAKYDKNETIMLSLTLKAQYSHLKTVKLLFLQTT